MRLSLRPSLLLLLLLFVPGLRSAPIYQSSDLLTGINRDDPAHAWSVLVVSTMTDVSGGAGMRFDWNYRVTNLSYRPNPLPPSVGRLLGNGITIFFVAQPSADGIIPSRSLISNISQPSGWGALLQGFLGDFERIEPITWRTVQPDPALEPGESGDFGFTITGPVVISSVRAFVSAESIGSSVVGPIDLVEGVLPAPIALPEPATWSLGGLGALAAVVLRCTRRLRLS